LSGGDHRSARLGLMEGHSVISADVLARYAADAAREVPGVSGVVEGGLPRHRGVRVGVEGDAVTVELRLALDWGSSAQEVARAAQARVADYLGRMADVRPRSVDVVVDEIGPPPAAE
jgi:uncharacterized alkaline shock family protein YloU